MSTDSMPGHDELIEELLGELADRADPAADEDLRPPGREELELLGMLAYAEPPAVPSEAAKDRVLQAARQADGRVAEATAAVAEFARPEPAPGRWLLPLAATLALVSLAAAGLLYGQLQNEREISAKLAAALELAERSRTELAEARQQAVETRSQLELVTQPGVEICALRPGSGADGEPFGVLYVAPDHQHWYLSLHGLAPAPEGLAYQVWFLAEEGPVSAGTFAARFGEPIELGSETMPHNTSAVLVTMEGPEGAQEPSGPEVLFGDEVMRIL